MKIFGDGKQSRDFMHVSDLVNAYNLVLEYQDLIGETINFGTGKETAVGEIAEYIAKKMNAKIEHVAPRPGEVNHFGCNLDKAKALGFEAKMDIWDGIDQYIEWRRGI